MECTECKKWRLLRNIQDPSTLADKWLCEDSPDENYNSCEIAEERYDRNESFVQNLQFVPGSLVWSHNTTIPGRQDAEFPWAGMVEYDPEQAEFVDVTDSKRSALGHSWASTNMINCTSITFVKIFKVFCDLSARIRWWPASRRMG